MDRSTVPPGVRSAAARWESRGAEMSAGTLRGDRKEAVRTAVPRESQQEAEVIPVALQPGEDVLHHPQLSLGLRLVLRNRTKPKIIPMRGLQDVGFVDLCRQSLLGKGFLLGPGPQAAPLLQLKSGHLQRTLDAVLQHDGHNAAF
ncbi:hypothetical protein EYF80_040717 [Liparis tanakae]|uniref:Uncharacterized protein n=1 Tax=Liparis tanakae TaxID=230148 RepID=A0A4Z2G9A8_9TELE|nr:hypothetical protein EYF80_040717 [Liparis tanakae]